MMRLGTASRLGATLLLVLFATGWLAAPAMAGEPMLTVAGPGGGAERQLTLGELRRIGGVEITTTTPWTEGTVTFTGVTGRQLVAALGADGGEVLADAINDYRVTIPFEVFDSDDLLIAYARDGAEMPVRDKGPLWIVFPFDSDARYVSEIYKAYSIWNLYRLEFH